MKKMLLGIVCLMCISESLGQKLEFTGGINLNRYLDADSFLDGYLPPGLKWDTGYQMALSLRSIRWWHCLPVKVTLRLDYVKGRIDEYYGGMGGGTSYHAAVDKINLGFGFFPVNIKIAKKFWVSIGGELSGRVWDHTTGEKWAFSMYATPPVRTWSLDDDALQLNKDFFFGVSADFSYDFWLSDVWHLAPHYRFYLGLTDEFRNLESSIRSVRNYFEMGIIRRI
ncbi:MAG TPA: hypothetical protein P5228_05340 [Bacteroidales bacterium]|nr:hypothetical protein [Bacteroidales bacterium]HRZ47771.1 hypothetical protein [Bacteroidales bacterium]